VKPRDTTNRLVFICLGLIAATGHWYWQHLKFESGRGMYFMISPAHRDVLLLGVSVIATGVVLYSAWSE
jgi:hypothetical protein